MVKYTLEIEKNFCVITPEVKDKFPKMVDIGENNELLTKKQLQASKYVYITPEGKEISIAAGKGIVKDSKVIPLKKVENLKAFQVEKVKKAEIFNYAVQGTYKVLKTDLNLAEDEAITFIWALSKGYLNTIRGFIFRQGEEYLLVKASISSIAKLTESFKIVEDEVKGQVETVNPLEQLEVLK